MQNNKKTDKQQKVIKKHSFNRSSHIGKISPIVFVSLLLFLFLFVFILVLKANYNSRSDIVIRLAAAGILNKDPNELTNDDFKKITSLNLDGKELKNTWLLRKFTNLEELYMANVRPRKFKVSKWMLVLEKVRLLDLSQRELISIKPLEKLTKLKTVTLIGSNIKDIKPLAKLKNLKQLNLNETPISDIEPVKDLVNLEGLYLSKTKVSDIEPIKNLTKLKSLYLENTMVSNLEPVENLTNLLQLRLKNSNVTDLKPLYKLTNLQKLFLGNSSPRIVTQANNLQKALPNLYIDIIAPSIVPESQSEHEIIETANNLSGLIHYWSFDENEGDIFYDSVSDKNGQIYGAKWTNGISRSALILDGIDDYAELPDNNPIWLPENDFTVSVWVFLNAYATSNNMILDLNYSRTNETGYNILYTKNKPVFQLHTTSKVNEDLYSNLPIGTNQWYHICIVRNGTNQTMYINGKENISRKSSDKPIRFLNDYDDNKVNIGRYTTVLAQPRYFLNGKIDELKIYSHALSDYKIEQIYNDQMK